MHESISDPDLRMNLVLGGKAHVFEHEVHVDPLAWHDDAHGLSKCPKPTRVAAELE